MFRLPINSLKRCLLKPMMRKMSIMKERHSTLAVRLLVSNSHLSLNFKPLNVSLEPSIVILYKERCAIMVLLLCYDAKWLTSCLTLSLNNFVKEMYEKNLSQKLFGFKPGKLLLKQTY